MTVRVTFSSFYLLRSPGIFDKDIIKKLFQRYGKNAPPIPALPVWYSAGEKNGNSTIKFIQGTLGASFPQPSDVLVQGRINDEEQSHLMVNIETFC